MYQIYLHHLFLFQKRTYFFGIGAENGHISILPKELRTKSTSTCKKSVKCVLNVTVWKKQKLTLTWKIFRGINYLNTFLSVLSVEKLISRNFLWKLVMVKFCHFYTVHSQLKCHSDFGWNQFLRFLLHINFDFCYI